MRILMVAALVFLNPALSSKADVVIDWVNVGNPGNGADTNGVGSVDYVYRIAKTEVTNSQYVEFLNAVAALDTHSVYSPSMGSNPRGGITQSGNSGTFTYSVKPSMGNKPVNYVSFFDAMRFANWLHNGQPTGLQTAATTETGAYTITMSLPAETREAGALFFIPTEDEWFKAAYHMNDGATSNYFDYAIGSDDTPTIATANSDGDISNPGEPVVNYAFGADWNGQDGNVTSVGSAGTDNSSPYGTFDQNGNVGEWNESLASDNLRGQRGGGWDNFLSSLRASAANSFANPGTEARSVGFRLAAPVEVILAPGSINVTRGEFISGDLAELLESDNSDFSLRRLTSDIQSRTEFEVKSVSPTEIPSSLQVTLEGAVFARSDVIQTIELFDYVTESWALIDSSVAARFSDATVVVSATNNLSRFVETGSRCIEARIRYRSANPRQQFSSNTDQFIWTIGL